MAVVTARAPTAGTVRTRARRARADASMDASRAREGATRTTRRVALAGAVTLIPSTVSRARQGNVARAGESDDTIAYEDLVVGSGVEPLVGVDVVKVDARGDARGDGSTRPTRRNFSSSASVRVRSCRDSIEWSAVTVRACRRCGSGVDVERSCRRRWRTATAARGVARASARSHRVRRSCSRWNW